MEELRPTQTETTRSQPQVVIEQKYSAGEYIIEIDALRVARLLQDNNVPDNVIGDLKMSVESGNKKRGLYNHRENTLQIYPDEILGYHSDLWNRATQYADRSKLAYDKFLKELSSEDALKKVPEVLSLLEKTNDEELYKVPKLLELLAWLDGDPLSNRFGHHILKTTHMSRYLLNPSIEYQHKLNFCRKLLVKGTQSQLNSHLVHELAHVIENKGNNPNIKDLRRLTYLINIGCWAVGLSAAAQFIPQIPNEELQLIAWPATVLTLAAVSRKLLYAWNISEVNARRFSEEKVFGEGINDILHLTLNTAPNNLTESQK